MPDYHAMARAAAAKYGIDPDIFERQINQESGFNPSAVSPAGAIGIAQIVPKYHPGVNASDPEVALDYSARLMSTYLNSHNGNWAAALSDYNAGAGAENKDARGVAGNSETQNYVSSILGGASNGRADTSLGVGSVASPGQVPPGGIPDGKGNFTMDPETAANRTWYSIDKWEKWTPPGPTNGNNPNGSFSSATKYVPPAGSGTTGGAGAVGSGGIAFETQLPSGRYQAFDQYGTAIGTPYDAPKLPSTTQTGNNAATTAVTSQNNLANQALTAARDKAAQANADRDYAMKVGDSNLAQQKEADLNYWNGITNQLTQNTQAVTARGQDITAADSAAQISELKYQSDQSYQAAMAQATNSQQQNEITNKWNQEQAAIEKMKDATVERGQQSTQFNNETTRQDLQTKNELATQKQILDEASAPRNLMNLYMTQRGLKPDWQNLMNGGAPASMTPLAPGGFAGIYQPTTAAPTFGGANPLRDAVGAATAGGLGANTFLGPSTATAPVAAAKPAPWSPAALPAGGPPAFTPTPLPAATPAPGMPAAPDPYHSGGNTWTDDGTPGGRWTDPSGNYQSNGGGWTTSAGAPYSSVTPKQLTPGDATKGYGGIPAGGSGTTNPDGSWTPNPVATREASGGATHAPLIMAGDANAPDPTAGGAVPEIIHNPTGAPLQIEPNPDNIAGGGATDIKSIISRMLDLLSGSSSNSSMGSNSPGIPDSSMPAAPALGGAAMGGGTMSPEMSGILAMMAGKSPGDPARFALGTGPVDDGSDSGLQQQGDVPMVYNQPLRAPAYSRGGDNYSAVNQQGANPQTATPTGTVQQPAPWTPQNGGIMTGSLGGGVSVTPSQPLTAPSSAPQGGGFDAIAPGRMVNQTMSAPNPGTDTSGAYSAAGMGGQYQPSSANPGIDPNGVPAAIQMLMKLGIPIPPALLNSATGQSGPALNMAAAVTGGGLGGLPSLQSLNAMSPGERDLVGNGYYQGVGGIPWADLFDFISKGSQNLGTAAVSKGV